MKNTVLKILKIAIFVLAFAGLAVIALFPFKNRDITVKGYSSDNKIVFSDFCTAGTINENMSKSIMIQVSEDAPLLIRYVRFYGLSKTTIIKEMDYNEFARGIDSAENGTFTWTPKGLSVAGDGFVK